MKGFLPITTLLSLTIAIGCHTMAIAQTVAANPSEPKKASAKLADSDGDGIADDEDEHPFIADIMFVSWRISPVGLGWRADSTLDEQLTSLSESEREILKRKQFTFGGQADISVGIESGGKAQLSANPFKQFGMADSEAHIAYSARFGASGNVGWNKTDQETTKTLLHAVSQTKIAQRLSDLSLEFTVTFFNQSEHDFLGRNLQVPIKVGGEVVTYAQPVGANGPDLAFGIPAGHEHGIPIRFRAALDTTQSRTLLGLMQSRCSDISIEDTQGKIIAEINGRQVDAISTLTQIRKKTCLLTVELDGKELSWQVARRDEKTWRALHLSDAFATVNAMSNAAGGEPRKVFEYSEHYLRSALGRDDSLEPVRWWVIADRNSEKGVSDVDPSGELPSEIRLTYQFGFPKKMSRWVENVDSKDTWALNVAGDLSQGGRGGISINEKQAVAFFQKATYLGDSYAMLSLGGFHWIGSGGLIKDEKIAVGLFRQAADLGNSRGLFLLGAFYEQGEGGLLKDETKAVELYQKAVGLGDQNAMATLGACYIKGKGGLVKDERKAVELFQNAADLDNSFGIYNLGLCYGCGAGGLVKDERKAEELLKKAVNMGDSSACLHMEVKKMSEELNRHWYTRWFSSLVGK